MRGVFEANEATGERWRVALDLLRSGKAFSLGGVTFRRVDGDTVEAAVASRWLPENLTEAYATDDLESAQTSVQSLLADDEEFRDVVGGSSIDYVLVDDYDIGSIALCRLSDDGLEWLVPRQA
jgi:hypothetical protein